MNRQLLLSYINKFDDRITCMRETLEVLDISFNDLSDGGLPTWIREFPFLKCLELAHCKLTNLPPW